MGGTPDFPPPSVIDRAVELGFGSGPWERAELEARWGGATANRFIDDAKKAGWLLAPFRNVFFVPPARDLMVVGWLPSGLREEYIISRLLVASGLRNWCLSAWAREEGLVFPQPLFVTDLAEAPMASLPLPARSWRPPPDSRRQQTALARTERWGRLPFLDNVIIAPALPQASPFPLRTSAVLPVGTPPPGKFGQPAWPLKDPSGVLPDLAPEALVRLIPYELSPDVDDPAWIAALVAALRLPRFAERMEQLVESLIQADRKQPRRAQVERRKKGLDAFMGRWERWLSTMGEPESNGAWQERLRAAPVSYLLVPSWLWDEFNAARMSEKFVAMGDWRRMVGARS